MHDNIFTLTPTEHNVMSLVSKGYNLRYIANTLFIAERTVMNHLVHIYSKYGISNDDTYNVRTRAVYIYNEQKKLKLHKQIKELQDELNKEINNYTDFLECEEV